MLFAVVEANYIERRGRISNGGVFKHCGFSKFLESQKNNWPVNSTLPGKEKYVPYVLFANDACPLSPNIMKPYSGHQERESRQRIFV